MYLKTKPVGKMYLKTKNIYLKTKHFGLSNHPGFLSPVIFWKSRFFNANN